MTDYNSAVFNNKMLFLYPMMKQNIVLARILILKINKLNYIDPNKYFNIFNIFIEIINIIINLYNTQLINKSNLYNFNLNIIKFKFKNK